METRILADKPNYTGRDDMKWVDDWHVEEVVQTAIPWCTTHDQRANKDFYGEWSCWAETTDIRCVISLGGSDHRWWKDA